MRAAYCLMMCYCLLAANAGSPILYLKLAEVFHVNGP